jgi:hypothetical protein
MSTQTSLSEVQTAMYARLTSDTTLMALITAVYDFTAVPDNAVFPYATLGDATETPNNAFGRRGYNTRHLVHTWDSGYGGALKTQNIIARLNFLLDQQPMTLATQKLVYLLFQQAHILPDPGIDKIIHGVVEYDSFTQE